MGGSHFYQYGKLNIQENSPVLKHKGVFKIILKTLFNVLLKAKQTE